MFAVRTSLPQLLRRSLASSAPLAATAAVTKAPSTSGSVELSGEGCCCFLVLRGFFSSNKYIFFIKPFFLAAEIFAEKIEAPFKAKHKPRVFALNHVCESLETEPFD